MIRAAVFLAGVAAATAVAMQPAAGETDTTKHASEARALVKAFAGRLKKELVTALKSGGATEAVSVCNVAAPAIAAEKAEASGWEVGRTSLKLRNTGNAPDDWERRVLDMFEAKKAKGADPKTLEHFEVVQRDGKPMFRYMKAIPAGKPCLTCHGEALPPKLVGHLKSLYPNDKATGFKLGDLRGAFTLARPLE
ncbi:MAG: Tll0287-like domain-containing protein [Methyloligellaceae bacterium]